ncbi:fluoride efflux transporter CrcB [Staphylococcus kloosii]|uniref:fluoride efflux transporter CrcB n=1 Tax=Staphylococcus kloosii TaxID=29384 RepID=UPI0028A4BCF6|nr:fluoride efflux transporter CrcB [Staphylococcus kloosii]MDT3959995.1 fluoride efflux transporter CrcB [Staphylococcus kloosii]
MQYVYIFFGGAIGALLRYLLSFVNNEGATIPIGTFIANLIGALLMGFLGTLAVTYFGNNPQLKKGITTGFVGALTTFSTFQYELVSMYNAQSILTLFIYGISSYILGISFCYIGVKIGGKL